MVVTSVLAQKGIFCVEKLTSVFYNRQIHDSFLSITRVIFLLRYHKEKNQNSKRNKS